MKYLPTCDWFVYIEEFRDGYVRYINRDGRRWEVHGVCKNCTCWEGAVNEKPTLDCPVTPDFQYDGCELKIVELEKTDPPTLPQDNVPFWYKE